MLSTLRILRSRNLTSLELAAKTSTAGIHYCVKPVDTKRQKHAAPWHKQVPFTALPLSSASFMSTAPPVKAPTPDVLAQETIPEPPTPVVEPVNLQLHPNGEATFESIGLGGWSPVGMVQNCMEFLHVNLDIPWWGTIVIGTICVRTLIFPLVILAQRNAARMNNYLPHIQALQLQMTEARQRGDRLDCL